MEDQNRITMAVLVTSCKAYSDVRQIQDVLFDRYWDDCPYKKYLVVDELDEKDDVSSFSKVFVTKPEYKLKNTFRVIEALEQIEEKYVLLLQEDVLFNDKVHNSKIERILSLMDKHDVGLMKTAGGLTTEDVYSIEDQLMEMKPGMPYRISFPGGLWERQYCMDILSKYDNCADVEREGSEYSCNFEKRVLAPQYAVLPFIDGVRKGVWEPAAISLMNYNEIDTSTLQRPIMNAKTTLKFALMGYIFNINRRKFVKIQNKLKFGKKY